MARMHTVREHETLEVGDTLSAHDVEELRVFARKVLKLRDGDLAASNYVGIVTTSSGTVLEILPKIDLDDEAEGEYDRTREVFLNMLRRWRGPGTDLRSSDIRELSRFPMLEVFVRQFLSRVNDLIRHGLARRYVTVEENLPYLRGRIVFSHQVRENAANQARFYVAHSELTVDRPANRLIRSTLERLVSRVQTPGNRQALREALIGMADVPAANDVQTDWQRHSVDRSMRHYGAVMDWVGLFLFNQGLGTFSGTHRNLSLLFPMEQVFEDFVTDSFRRYQRCYRVRAQGPQCAMASIGDRQAFVMKPDVSLLSGGKVALVLDAKWKGIDATRDYPKHRISQDDLYQLHAYGAKYGCKAVALVYPRNPVFEQALEYRFFDDLPLLAIPFDVARPEEATTQALKALHTVMERRMHCIAPAMAEPDAA